MDDIKLENCINLLSDNDNYDFFTKLLQAKINGGLVSKIDLKKNLSLLKDIVDERKIFECPECGNTIHVGAEYTTYSCDCGKQIDINSVYFKRRYRVDDELFSFLKDFFAQKFAYAGKNILILFGENKKSHFKHTENIVLHITPFPVWEELDETKVKILDSAYADHFSIPWSLLLNTFVQERRNEIFEQILELRKELVERIVNWRKITPSDFEDLSIELLEKENKFSKIVSGGTGPDQGKDGFGYASVEMPSGKILDLRILIQCKHTLSHKSFTYDKIHSYVGKAKRHSCNGLLFITNGELSGDAITAIESGAFYDVSFREIDFFDRRKLLVLLEKHDDVRIAYFTRHI